MKWLRDLPSTNALVAMYIAVILATTVGVLCKWTPPDGWFPFVGGVGTLVSAHFTAKRLSQHKPPPGIPDSDGTASES
jgi:hypothetical protein